MSSGKKSFVEYFIVCAKRTYAFWNVRGKGLYCFLNNFRKWILSKKIFKRVGKSNLEWVQIRRVYHGFTENYYNCYLCSGISIWPNISFLVEQKNIAMILLTTFFTHAACLLACFSNLHYVLYWVLCWASCRN